jgi:hypothetical protein
MKIPVYDDAQVQSADMPAPFRDVRATGISEGLTKGIEQVGQSVSQATGYIAEEQRKAKERFDESAQMAADIDYEKRADAISQPIFNAKGEGAMAASQDYEAQLAKARDDVAKEHFQNNPEALSRFTLKANEKALGYHRQVERHVANEAQASVEAEAQAQVTLTKDYLSKFPDAEDVEQRKAAIDESLKRISLNPDDYKARVEKAHGEIHQAVLDSLLGSKNYESAQAYLNAPGHLQELGPLAKHYQSAISTAQDQVGAAVDAKRILDGAQSTSAAGIITVDRAKVLVELNNMKPGQRRELTEQLVNRDIALADHQATQRKSELYTAAYSQYQRGGQRLAAVDPSLLTMMTDNDPDGHRKFMSIVRADQDHALSGRASRRPTADNDAAFVDFLTHASEHPEDFMGMDSKQFSRTYQADLGPHFVQASEKFAAIQKEKGAKLKDADSVVTSLAKTVYPEKKLSEDQQSAVLWARDQVRANVQNYVKEHNGKPPPLSEMSRWAEEAFVKVKVRNTGFFSGRREVSRRVHDQLEVHREEGRHRGWRTATTARGRRARTAPV